MSDFVVCVPVDGERLTTAEAFVVENSTIDICRTCEASIWISPEAHDLIYIREEAEPICISCGAQQMGEWMDNDEEFIFAAPPLAPDWVKDIVDIMNEEPGGDQWMKPDPTTKEA